jgi:hypothetical protein
MKTSEDIVTLIAGFYCEQCTDSSQPNRDYTGEFMSLLRRLHDRVFPGYAFDREQLLAQAQAQAQLRGNPRAVHNYYPVLLKFAPLAGNGSPLVLHLGGVSAGGLLGLWAEERVINEQIQSALREGEGKGSGH